MREYISRMVTAYSLGDAPNEGFQSLSSGKWDHGHGFYIFPGRGEILARDRVAILGRKYAERMCSNQNCVGRQ